MARYFRDPSDIQAWLSQRFTGSVETTVQRWWRLFPPGLKLVVIRRPLEEVVDSLMKIDTAQPIQFDRARLMKNLGKYDRALDVIERRLSPLTIPYDRLGSENICKLIFEHCLGLPHDHERWAKLADVNIQVHLPAEIRYSVAFLPQLMQGGRSAARAIFQSRRGALAPNVLSVDDDGVTIQEEPLALWYRDGQELFRQHCLAVGEPEDEWTRKNLPVAQRLEGHGMTHILTARLDGRMYGYLCSLIAPSMEHLDRAIATQTLFFVDPAMAWKKIGLKLLRMSIERLRLRGVSEIGMRAGVRGSGPDLGILYRRVGAQPFGTLYKLTFDRDIEPASVG